MPRGKRGGRRGPSKRGFGNKREIEYKEEGEEYAQVKKMLGNMRLSVYCFDGKTRIAKVRGSIRRVRIRLEDIVIISLREFDDDKCDVIHVYRPEEAKILKANQEIPADVEISDENKPELIVNFENEDPEEKKVRQKSNIDQFMPNSDSEGEEDSEKSSDGEEDQESHKKETFGKPNEKFIKGQKGGSDDELADI